MIKKVAIPALRPSLAARVATPPLARRSKERVVDLGHVPQSYETKEQNDGRRRWFRDGKFRMFIHCGPCLVQQEEMGWRSTGT